MRLSTKATNHIYGTFIIAYCLNLMWINANTMLFVYDIYCTFLQCKYGTAKQERGNLYVWAFLDFLFLPDMMFHKSEVTLCCLLYELRALFSRNRHLVKTWITGWGARQIIFGRISPLIIYLMCLDTPNQYQISTLLSYMCDVSVERKNNIESLGHPKRYMIQIFKKYGVISECVCGTILCLTIMYVHILQWNKLR